MIDVTRSPQEGQLLRMAQILSPTRVVLADDHDVVRRGLRRLLERAPGIEVIGEASDGLQALQTVENLRPDVLLLDIEMPVMDGIEVARRIQASGVKVNVLILSAYDDREYIRALFDIGVSGYLIKGEAPGKIVEAVRDVAQGKSGLASPQVIKRLEKIQDAEAHSYRQNTLTYRELEILRLMAHGKTDAQIEKQLKLNHSDYYHMVQQLLQKVGVQSLSEAVRVSLSEGWISN
jgi:DNA-binding NarL/FixJ family response regulator